MSTALTADATAGSISSGIDLETYRVREGLTYDRWRVAHHSVRVHRG